MSGEDGKGYMLCNVYAFCALFESLFTQQAFYYGVASSINIGQTLMTMVFDKALLMPPERSESTSSTGKIVNLMS